VVRISDFSGQQLIQHEVNEPDITIDFSTLPGGIYIVKPVGEKGVKVGKFIKQ
jgi:hypothetical protein